MKEAVKQLAIGAAVMAIGAWEIHRIREEYREEVAACHARGGVLMQLSRDRLCMPPLPGDSLTAREKQ